MVSVWCIHDDDTQHGLHLPYSQSPWGKYRVQGMLVQRKQCSKDRRDPCCCCCTALHATHHHHPARHIQPTRSPWHPRPPPTSPPWPPATCAPPLPPTHTHSQTRWRPLVTTALCCWCCWWGRASTPATSRFRARCGRATPGQTSRHSCRVSGGHGGHRGRGPWGAGWWCLGVDPHLATPPPPNGAAPARRPNRAGATHPSPHVLPAMMAALHALLPHSAAGAGVKRL